MLDILNKIRNKFFPSKIAKFWRGLGGAYQRWEDRMFERLSAKPRRDGFETHPAKTSGFRIGMYLACGLIIGSVIFFTGDFVTATMIRIGNSADQNITQEVTINSLDQYLVRYYKMNFATSTTVRDYSTAATNGTLAGTGYSQTADGKIDKGLSISGTGNVNTSKSLDTAQDWSISFWFYNPSISGNEFILNNYSTAIPAPPWTRGFFLYEKSDKTLAFNNYCPSVSETINLGGLIPDSTWTLITLVYDKNDVPANSTLKTYQDTTLINTTTRDWTICNYSSAPVYIARDASTISASFDEFRIYEGIALSDTQITNIYNYTGSGANRLKLGSATTQSRANSFQYIKGTNLLRYFKMDMTSSTAVKDFSDYATDGLRSGATATGAGKIGAGMSYDGASDYVTTSSDVIDETADFSIATWMRLTGADANIHTIFANNAGTVHTGGILLQAYSNAQKFRLYSLNSTAAHDATPHYEDFAYTITAGRWYHTAVTYTKTDASNGTLTLYVDGAVVGSLINDEGFVLTNALYQYFGGESAAGANSFLGTIDEARIYNKALSADEILDLYNLPNNLTTGSLSKWLVGRWELSKDSLQSSTRFGDSTPYNKTGISANALNADNFEKDASNKVDGAMTFNGVSDVVAVGNTGKTAKAVRFWVYIDPADYPDFGTVTWTEVYPPTNNVAPANAGWMAVASDNDGSTLIAGVYGGSLWVSSDGGVTWGSGGLNPGPGWATVASDDDGSNLIAAHGQYYVGELYTSTDGGISWIKRNPGGNGKWYSVASNSDGSTLIAAAYKDHIYVSTNYGVDGSWSDVNPGGGASPLWTSVTSDSTGHYLTANAYGGGFYVSSDSGVTWSANRSFSSYNNCMASDSTGAKLIGGWYSNKIYTSTNYGINWTARTPVGNWVKTASDYDGSTLLVGDNAGLLYSSIDAGINWTALSPPTAGNWQGVALDSDGSNLIAGIYNGRLYTGTQPVINDELMEFGDGKTVTIVDNVVTTNLTSPTIYIDGQETIAFGSTGWHEVTINTDTGFAVSDFNIGKVGGSYFDGRLSDVRLYSSYTTLQDGLLAYWPMDEGTSNKIYDFSGNNNTGTLTNMADPATATSGWGAGYNNSGLNFSSAAVYDYVSVGTISIADDTPWSVSVWVKPTYLGYYVGIYGNGYGAGNWTRLMLNGSDIYLSSDDNVIISWPSAGTTLNVWNHIVVTCDGQATATCYAFVNGKRLPAKTLVNSLQTIKVIGSLGSSSYSFQGSMDDLRFYSRELSMDEIKQLYSL